ncbi:MAG: chloride channel protein [Holophagaceae bacterium]|nr:chloride channel protein [Holophagaceae bacterium]
MVAGTHHRPARGPSLAARLPAGLRGGERLALPPLRSRSRRRQRDGARRGAGIPRPGPHAPGASRAGGNAVDAPRRRQRGPRRHRGADGASLARTLGKLPFRWLRLTRSRQRLLIMAGISGGFGSLFGTPAAGALFGLEAIAPGRLHPEGLVICTAASFVGDLACRALGGQHAAWQVASLPFGWGTLGKAAAFAVPVALLAVAFARGCHGLAAWTRDRFRHWALRPLLGGLLVGGLYLVFPDDGFLNLGLPFLSRIFAEHGPVAPWAFAVKLLFTCVTLGFGFKGGEVTPLFVIGALLGCAFAPLLGWPPGYTAALGMTGLFAAASNTPLASLVLGIELFGPGFAAPLAVVCFLAFVLAGHPGIYGNRAAQGVG